jgi:diguanylate cyclase (GGDEF)-like protein
VDGNFIFAKRENDGFSLKKIVVQDKKRQTTLTLFNNNLEPVSVEQIPNDQYDPRQRSWFKAAFERKALIWTGPYVFFSSQRPGITTAIPARIDQKILGVVGVDIEISVLSEFIATIPTSPNGAAFIATKNGEVVGMPNLSSKFSGRVSTLPRLEDIGTTEAKTLAQLGNDTSLLQQFQAGNRAWVGILRPLLVNQDATWQLGLYAPKSDFVGATESIFNRQLVTTVVISVVVLLGAVLLIWSISSPIENWYKRATTDELTQLLNRSEFLLQAKKTLQHTTSPSVLVMFDLDRFKTVNDVFGHDAGDKVLATIAQRLRHRVRAYDLTARFGGDEFAILLPNISLEVANARLEEWRKEIVEPFRQMVSVSVGLTPITKDDNLEVKIIEADHALLRSKKSGKDQVSSSQA